MTDSGPLPRPAPELVIPCTDSPGDVYLTPAGLSPHTAAERGRIVRCAPSGSASRDEVVRALSGVSGLTVTSGYRAYLVAYRTERDSGVGGIGTARLLVPDTPAAGARPVAVVTHGTAGLADSCAPSRYPVADNSAHLALPWIGAGLAVIAPDYAGLGNEGVQGYGNNADTAHSTLDAARAAIAALTPGSVDAKVIVAGHSQGGGAAIAAQAHAGSYATGGGASQIDIAAIVSYAGGAASGGASSLRFPRLPITGGEGVTRAVIALALYADFANLFGDGRAAEPLNPAIRTHVEQAIESECIFRLVDSLGTAAPGYVPPDTVGELVDPTFRDAFVQCLDGMACSPDIRAFTDRANANTLDPDNQGAPILVLSGALDAQQPPARQSCLIDLLANAGAPHSKCLFAGLTHFDIVPGSAAYALQWSLAVVEGRNAPACPASETYPRCRQ